MKVRSALFILNITAQLLCCILSIISIYDGAVLSIPILVASFSVARAMPYRRFMIMNALLQLVLLFLSILLFMKYPIRPDRQQIQTNTHSIINLQLRVASTSPLLSDHQSQKSQKIKAYSEHDVIWHPKNFNFSDLPRGRSSHIQQWLTQHVNVLKPPKNLIQAGRELALSVFALDIPALRYLLVDVGVPATASWMVGNEFRPPLVTLSVLGILTERNPKSLIMSLLKGRPCWLDEHLDPPLPHPLTTVHVKDIIDSLAAAIHNVTLWLIRAGADVNAADNNNFSALDHASLTGFDSMVTDLLGSGQIDVNLQRRPDNRTALHYALAYGRTRIAEELVRHGADLTLADKWKVTALDIIANPGTVPAEDAFQRFGVKQRPVRIINRVLHPEQLPSVEDPRLTGGNVSIKELRDFYRSWPGGTGGWSPERLKGYEVDMHCDVDQYWADELTSEQLFSQYIARNAPVLIRGLIHDWEAINAYSANQLMKSHGKMRVTVSDIPYSTKVNEMTGMSLLEYSSMMQQHRLPGGEFPWYVFKGHKVPEESSQEGSIVHPTYCPTPALLRDAFRKQDSKWALDMGLPVSGPESMSATSGGSERKDELFSIAQWAFGGGGSGSQVHYHKSAWNALVYGAKKWLLYTPEHQITSDKHIGKFMHTDMQDFASRPQSKGFYPKTCVQTAGDLLIIPESWGHGVLNIQESVAIATESVKAHWRVYSGDSILAALPQDPTLGAVTQFARPIRIAPKMH